jgi:hypothetical protein
VGTGSDGNHGHLLDMEWVSVTTAL